MINNAIKEGEWVYLQNCHLCASWMPGLEKILEELAQKELHEDYRLWLTTMPALHFPTMVLQSGLKIVKEPPKGMRANLRDTIVSVLPESLWEGCTKEYQWKKLVFSLVFFHGLIQVCRVVLPRMQVRRCVVRPQVCGGCWRCSHEFSRIDCQMRCRLLHSRTLSDVIGAMGNGVAPELIRFWCAPRFLIPPVGVVVCVTAQH